MVIDISLLGNLSGVASIGLGIFVYFSNPRRNLNRSLALFSFLLGIWVFALYFYSHPLWLSSESWIKITYLIVILYLSVLTYFIYHFPETDRYSKWLVPHLIFCALTNIPLVVILLFTKLWIVDVLPGPKGLETVLGPAYMWWGIITILNLVYLYPLFIRFKNSTGIRKQQIYFFAIGNQQNFFNRNGRLRFLVQKINFYYIAFFNRILFFSKLNNSKHLRFSFQN